MVALAWHVHQMSVREFLRWDPGDGLRYELVDGEPRAMAPTSTTHGILQGEIAALIRNHIKGTGLPCVMLTNPGVIPEVLAVHNFRIPDVGVSCARSVAGQASLPEPVLLVEILSPSNKADTWSNVWTYTSIPSVREILVLHTSRVLAQVLQRSPDETWPEQPAEISAGTLTLNSIGMEVSMADLYAATELEARA